MFTLTNEVKANFEVKTIKGRECVKLNVLFDSGATLSLISKSIVDILKAKTGLDANRRFMGAQPGITHGATKFTNALFYNENMEEFMKTASLHVNGNMTGRGLRYI